MLVIIWWSLASKATIKVTAKQHTKNLFMLVLVPILWLIPMHLLLKTNQILSTMVQSNKKNVLKATRGNIGIGAMASGAGSGISLKFHPFGRVGFQTIGWALKDGDESKYNLRYRYYEIEDMLLGIDNLAIVYLVLAAVKSPKKMAILLQVI